VLKKQLSLAGLIKLVVVGLWAALFSATALAKSYQVHDTTRAFPAQEVALALREDPYRVSLFDPQYGEDKERLWSQTKLIFGLGLGVAGFIAALPPDISNWDRSDDRIIEKWWNNVREGPVWDRDVWYINYIGHPYFGNVYYQVARKSGYRQWDSFVYSFLMSTFYWEYGLEAFAEVPSIQDLVVTPVGGWIWGEWSYQKEKEIRRRGGTVYGSQRWGDIALFLLDPVDSIGVGINKLMGRDVVTAGTAWVAAKPSPAVELYESSNDYYWSINIAYQF
jgi:hypothetical protein